MGLYSSAGTTTSRRNPQITQNLCNLWMDLAQDYNDLFDEVMD